MREQLVETLGKLAPLQARFKAAIHAGIADGSPAANVRALPFGGYAWSFASSSWAMAADNVWVWHQLVDVVGRHPMVAHATLARAAMEGAVMCRWLVDPNVTPADLRQRCLTTAATDAKRRRQFEESLPTPPAGLQGVILEQRLLAGIAAEGLQVGNDPEITSLFERYAVPGRADGKWSYRLLSGYAHGRQWASTTGHVTTEAIDSDLGVATWTAETPNTLTIANCAMAALSQALTEFETFVGYLPVPGTPAASPST